MYNIKTGQHNGSWDTPTSHDTVISCVCQLGMCVEPTETHPLIGYMRQELLLRMHEAIPGNLDSSACAETHLVTRQKKRRGVTWVRSDQNRIKTRLELRVTSIMENDNSYKDNYYT